MNHLDAKPIARMAERLAAIIPDAQARARFVSLAQRAMLDDERCGIEASEEEIAAGPPWAALAAREGRVLYIFHPHPDAITALRRAARALRDACLEGAELEALPSPSARDAMVRDIAGDLIAKLDRLSLDALGEKAAYIAAERRRRLSTAKAEEILFPQQDIFAAPGRVWRRIISSAELGRVGTEMRNCLAARSGRHRSFARQLSDDSARFWVLRDQADRARAVVMTDAARACVVEARGLRNEVLALDDPHLRSLMRTLGVAYSPAAYAIAARRRQQDAAEDAVIAALDAHYAQDRAPEDDASGSQSFGSQGVLQL